MKILNFGSLNIDKTYVVDHISKEGETITALNYEQFLGGKGFNQSIALARAGAKVFHAGKVGFDGEALVEQLKLDGINTDNIAMGNENSGHAIIQIDNQGKNSIIVDGGTNRTITKAEVDTVFDNFGKGDWLLLQNEISELKYIVNSAKEKGFKIALNASPIDPSLMEIDFNKVDILFINEIEGYCLTGEKSEEKNLK